MINCMTVRQFIPTGCPSVTQLFFKNDDVCIDVPLTQKVKDNILE